MANLNVIRLAIPKIDKRYNLSTIAHHYKA